MEPCGYINIRNIILATFKNKTKKNAIGSALRCRDVLFIPVSSSNVSALSHALEKTPGNHCKAILLFFVYGTCMFAASEQPARVDRYIVNRIKILVQFVYGKHPLSSVLVHRMKARERFCLASTLSQEAILRNIYFTHDSCMRCRHLRQRETLTKTSGSPTSILTSG